MIPDRIDTLAGICCQPTGKRMVSWQTDEHGCRRFQFCTITSADSSSGNSALFTCQHTWAGTGSQLLTATFSASVSHDDSSDQMTQGIVADEFIFHDRFEEDPWAKNPG
jgi:hypothetical protein